MLGDGRTQTGEIAQRGQRKNGCKLPGLVYVAFSSIWSATQLVLGAGAPGDGPGSGGPLLNEPLRKFREGEGEGDR